jgi:two-component system response regulator NreC
MKIQVLIVDDHAVLRAGLRVLINAQPDMETVGEAVDGLEAVSKARETQPNVILMDLTMPGHGGLTAIANLRSVCPDARVLVLTMHDHSSYFRSVLAAGAVGYVVKTAADTELLTAIRAVSQGRTFVDLSLSRDETQGFLDSKKSRASMHLLSDREREVLDLVAQGFTNQDVAARLKLSVKSVETYRARLMEKLDLRTRADLVRYALECGLLVPGKPQR